MLRTLIENTSNSVNRDNVKIHAPTLLSVQSLGRMQSPRSVCYDEANTPFVSELQLNKPTHMTKVDVMTLYQCKNCSTSYYCEYNPESCSAFCNKDCEACYSFLTGKQLL